MRRTALALALLAACESSAEPPNDDVPLPERVPIRDAGRDRASDAEPDDASTDAPVDSPTAACDTTKPFGAATHLPGAWVAAEHYSTPRLSADELTVYFTTHGAAGDAELGTAARSSIGAPFAAPALL